MIDRSLLLGSNAIDFVNKAEKIITAFKEQTEDKMDKEHQNERNPRFRKFRRRLR